MAITAVRGAIGTGSARRLLHGPHWGGRDTGRCVRDRICPPLGPRACGSPAAVRGRDASGARGWFGDHVPSGMGTDGDHVTGVGACRSHPRRSPRSRTGLRGYDAAGVRAILVGLMVLSAAGGADRFAELTDVSDGVRTAVLLLTIAGFGSKAGLVPLHAWLPRAHPEAPSPMSALMSAAMVNLGV